MEDRLTPQMVLSAYRAGIFPMAPSRDSKEINWHDPDLRGVLPIEALHVPKRLRKTIRHSPYRITFDAAFPAVIQACAAAREETWINDEIIALYVALHRQGHAHSVEAWEGDTLAGGLYGISIGGAFFGESMFSIRTDASKIALVHLAARLWKQGYVLLDTQFINKHLLQFGAIELPRPAYRALLQGALQKQVRFGKNQSPVSAGAGSVSTSMSSAPAGACSDENADESLTDISSFLQSITQTS